MGWDDIYGGMAQWVNVSQGGYEWPPETPVGTNFSFRFVGEYNYMKTLWGMNEVLVATLRVFERTKRSGRRAISARRTRRSMSAFA